ncbi:MAG: MipA/OmpV family protein [Fusobacterium necrophorum]|nr:MipA/OmpV family protein [Fusobacterium necrophorum]MCI7681490.1 MipA/OmpV family protein [Fusobacterium necrophorum]MDY2573013.1 MipA/OmpV family protein [Fusobacterium necrophorum]MDY6172815.1 MipA/OmpV family protein [Fusobacterium necrophorum]
MKKFLAVTGMLAFSIISYSEERASGISIGLVGAHSNGLYKLKSKEKSSFLPTISANYKNFYINQSEVGYELPVHENILVSPYFNFLDGAPVKGKDLIEGYQSLKTRKSQFVGGGRISYLKDNFQSSIFVQGGKRGSSGGAEVSLSFPLTERLSLSTGVNYTVYSKKFTDYYFGIHKEDLGGKLQKVYSPKASSSYGAEISLEYQVAAPLTVFTSASATNYSKQITDSPITKDKTNISTTVGLQYSF